MAAVLALLMGLATTVPVSPAPSPPVVASPGPTAPCPTDVSISGAFPLGLDGSLPRVAGWQLAIVPGPDSPSWYLTSPGRRIWLRVLAWPVDEVLLLVEPLASAGTPDLQFAWTTIFQVDAVGTTTVQLGGGVERPALRVRGKIGKDDTIQGGYLTWWTVEDDLVAVIATADRDCLPPAEPVLRSLLAAVQPPTERLVPASTPLIIEVGGSTAP